MGYYYNTHLFAKPYTTEKQKLIRPIFNLLSTTDDYDWLSFKTKFMNIMVSKNSLIDEKTTLQACELLGGVFFDESYVGEFRSAGSKGYYASNTKTYNKRTVGYCELFTEFKSLDAQDFEDVVTAISLFDKRADIRAVVIGDEGESTFFRRIRGKVDIRIDYVCQPDDDETDDPLAKWEDPNVYKWWSKGLPSKYSESVLDTV